MAKLAGRCISSRGYSSIWGLNLCEIYDLKGHIVIQKENAHHMPQAWYTIVEGLGAE